ncbi:hypothetical protein PENSPDRAFT_753660 [Peniophora sp. CONT]|nr:hypothetical protein PENSPDRAFT_753660 [Peniophora sp. CONT]
MASRMNKMSSRQRAQGDYFLRIFQVTRALRLALGGEEGREDQHIAGSAEGSIVHLTHGAERGFVFTGENTDRVKDLARDAQKAPPPQQPKAKKPPQSPPPKSAGPPARPESMPLSPTSQRTTFARAHAPDHGRFGMRPVAAAASVSTAWFFPAPAAAPVTAVHSFAIFIIYAFVFAWRATPTTIATSLHPTGTEVTALQPGAVVFSRLTIVKTPGRQSCISRTLYGRAFIPLTLFIAFHSTRGPVSIKGGVDL